MKLFIHLFGRKEGFRTVLTILQKESQLFMLTDSAKRAKIFNRKLQLNNLKSALTIKSGEEVTVGFQLPKENCPPVMLVYPAVFRKESELNDALQIWQEKKFSKIFLLMPESLAALLSNLTFPYEYLFLNEIAVDKSEGLTFVSVD